MQQAGQSGSVERQIIEGAARRCARHGFSRTTISDIARESGVSRATIYRVFPAGRDGVVRAVRKHEMFSFFTELEAEVASGTSLEETISLAVWVSSCMLRDDVSFQRQLTEDPGPLLESLSGRGLERLHTAARVFIGPHLEPFLGRVDAARTAEWLARIVLSYGLSPSPHVDLCARPDVERFVASRVMPGLVEHRAELAGRAEGP